MEVNHKSLFSLGQVVATPDALSALAAAGQSPMSFLMRHQSGDWGQLAEEDQRMNDQAVKEGARILSSYLLKETQQKIWIITESDRSSTCVLLPENY